MDYANAALQEVARVKRHIHLPLQGGEARCNQNFLGDFFYGFGHSPTYLLNRLYFTRFGSMLSGPSLRTLSSS